MTDEEDIRPEEAPAPEVAPDGGEPSAPAEAEPSPAEGSGARSRLLGSAVTLPWLFLYGVTGVWAVTLAARSAGEGLKRVDAGYTRYVSPPELAFVGALLLVAFAVMLACALLLLFRRDSAALWLPLLLLAAGLTAGAVWAGVEGGLHPLIWLFLFFGLAYVTVVALTRVVHVTRGERHDRIEPR
jgi:hypothetical protein